MQLVTTCSLATEPKLRAWYSMTLRLSRLRLNAMNEAPYMHSGNVEVRTLLLVQAAAAPAVNICHGIAWQQNVMQSARLPRQKRDHNTTTYPSLHCYTLKATT